MKAIYIHDMNFFSNCKTFKHIMIFPLLNFGMERKDIHPSGAKGLNASIKRIGSSLSAFILLMVMHCTQAAAADSSSLVLSCSHNNDLFRTLRSNDVPCLRFDSPSEAISHAESGSGVLVLADGYPQSLTPFDEQLFRKAKDKKLKLYIEYPSYVTGYGNMTAHEAGLKRIIATSDNIPDLHEYDIVEVHGCHFVTLDAQTSLLAIAQVAGFDRACFGLDEKEEQFPILFELSPDVMISTTKLSNFIQGRYAPKKAVSSILCHILKWATDRKFSKEELDWIPTVRPSYSNSAELPEEAELIAVQRGIDWYFNAGMLLNKDGWKAYKSLWHLDKSNMHTTVPVVDSACERPQSESGNGRFGVLEGIVSKVRYDGSQPTRWWLRSDSNGESSLAFALRWKLDGTTECKTVAKNLLDWVYRLSGLFQRDSEKSNFGLIYWAPGNAQALYQDNDIKSILGCIGTSAILGTDRWDESLAMNILGNFRTTGTNGFRGWRLENPELLKNGWKYYWEGNEIRLQPHYEAWTWASYLWLYSHTQWKPLLERTRKGIETMMKAYPDKWRWTNGIQQERGRMLLPLAWLIRVDDRPLYREWLKRIATDIERCQDISGAIQEEIGKPGQGDMVPPSSNAAYGKEESPLIQENGDKVADLLYTCNFTFLGLHEAYAATGDLQYKRMEDKLAEFLVRIQIKSEAHDNLDGGWFRAFDFDHWEYRGSNADSGWGAWAIETGWTQAWIPTVLSLRIMNENLWDLSRTSKIERKFTKVKRKMFCD